MANTKTFADMKKPVRQPTPEQIAAFEETGRALTPAKTETRKPSNTEIREPVETVLHGHGRRALQGSTIADSQSSVKAETRKTATTETRISGPIARLTIDLAEADHTRFKVACAMTKRKMVEEVRGFIEQRTVELEGQAGRTR